MVNSIIEWLLLPVAALAAAVVIDSAILELSPVELIRVMADALRAALGG